MRKKGIKKGDEANDGGEANENEHLSVLDHRRIEHLQL